MSPTSLQGPRPVALVIPPTTPIVITIDGPAGTGKSSVARLLARRLGLDFLDTGAMYRAAAAISIDHGLPPGRPEALIAKVAEADLHFDWTRDPPTILAWNKPIDARIRDGDVTAIVSRIAGIPALRRHMVAKQRLIAMQHPRLVTEGRDQGSAVFPDAAVKFFLDADPGIRAARRVDQLRAGGHETPDTAAMLREIIARDASDSSRADGPLVCPESAIRIDTSTLSLAEVVSRLESLVHAHFDEP